MRRHLWRSIAAACGRFFAVLIAVVVVMIVTLTAGDAKTWHWTYVTSTPNSPFVAAQSTVSISASSIHMEYTIPLRKRQVVIESCSGDLRDVQDATTLRSAGTTYLVVRFKLERSASCTAGKRLSVALPAADPNDVEAIATAINASCCSVAVRAATPRPRVIGAATPVPSPTKTPEPSPSPSPRSTAASNPTATPAASAMPSPTAAGTPNPAGGALQDWVENDGLFWFVRIRNSSKARLTPAGDVFNCRNVGVGCGAFAPTQLEPGGTATVATVAAANPTIPASFQYRFTASDGTYVVGATGSSIKAAPRAVPPMSAAELRAAEAGALDQLRAPSDALTPATPVRLVKRGSSRLAIGQTGTAVVRLIVAANGTPQEATIVSITNKELTAAAIETAVSSTYSPAMKNGRAVAGKYVATFSFDGQDPALASVPAWKRSPSPQPSRSPEPSPTPSTPVDSPSASPDQSPSQTASPPPSLIPTPAPTPAAPQPAPSNLPTPAEPQPASSNPPTPAAPPPAPPPTPPAPQPTPPNPSTPPAPQLAPSNPPTASPTPGPLGRSG